MAGSTEGAQDVAGSQPSASSHGWIGLLRRLRQPRVLLRFFALLLLLYALLWIERFLVGELGSTTFLPTHQIAPDIDNERDFVGISLLQTGRVTKTLTFQFVPPEFGHNLAGDVFFTYGKAVVLWLR